VVSKFESVETECLFYKNCCLNFDRNECSSIGRL